MASRGHPQQDVSTSVSVSCLRACVRVRVCVMVTVMEKEQQKLNSVLTLMYKLSYNQCIYNLFVHFPEARVSWLPLDIVLSPSLMPSAGFILNLPLHNIVVVLLQTLLTTSQSNTVSMRQFVLKFLHYAGRGRLLCT